MRKTVTGPLYVSLIALCAAVDGSLAQQRHPLQAQLEGQWSVAGEAGAASTELAQFLALAETNLTAAGERFRAAYAADAPRAARACAMTGALAGDPVDFRIVDRGDVIDITAFGRTRHVLMDYGREPPATFVPNELGWSVGRWVGNMLVVRTRHFSEGAVRLGERPLPFGSPLAQVVERYTLGDDANGLTVAVNLNDPRYYLFSLRVRHRYARTQQSVAAAECVPATGG